MSTIPSISSLALGSARTVDFRVLEQLFDLTPDTAFFIKDTSGRYVLVNNSLVERIGLAGKDHLLGRRASEIYPGEFGSAPADQDTTVLRTGKPILDHLELHWHLPNQPCWCLTTKLPLRDESGQITGLIGISRDIGAAASVQDIPPGLSKALNHLEKSYDGTVTPSLLAKRAGLSAPRFARLVKRIFGITPGQLIAKTRLAAASQLLIDSQRTIAEIALDCGFYDHSAFTRAFRSATGMSPTQFRTTKI